MLFNGLNGCLMFLIRYAVEYLNYQPMYLHKAICKNIQYQYRLSPPNKTNIIYTIQIANTTYAIQKLHYKFMTWAPHHQNFPYRLHSNIVFASAHFWFACRAHTQENMMFAHPLGAEACGGECVCVWERTCSGNDERVAQLFWWMQ